ncbi:MAG: energy transducer TonB [Candidatus Schekmanbacteria bacterium]|nr:energy transducer TonB [Candidatus Schekmanbacteria bacterium]
MTTGGSFAVQHRLALAIATSVVAHTLGLALLPGMQSPLVESLQRFQVHLLEPVVPEPVSPRVTIEPVKPAPAAPRAEVAPRALPKERLAALGAALRLPPPPIELAPTHTASPPRLPDEQRPSAREKDRVPDWLRRKATAPGAPAGTSAREEIRQAEAALGAAAAGSEAGPAIDVGQVLSRMRTKEADFPEIRGPAAARDLVYKPPRPHAAIPEEMVIELKFWVSPDGRVTRVVPQVKGNSALEKIAIEFLLRFRFNALPAGEPQVEQWGIIPFKFARR